MADDIKVTLTTEDQSTSTINKVNKAFKELKKTLKELDSGLENYSDSVNDAGQSTRQAEQQNIRYGRSYADVAKRALVAFNAVAIYSKAVKTAYNFVKDSLKVYADFEKGLSNVKAILQPTATEFNALESEAKKLGETTSFTAKQAVDAFTELGRAGFKTGEILESTSSVLALAAATTISLEKAATITAQAMNQFSGEGVTAAEVADTYAAAASNSALSSETLAASMVKVGTTAGQLGVEMSDTTAALGVLADVGIKGGAAGTQLNRTLILMNDETSKVGKRLQELGVFGEDFVTQLEALRKEGLTANEIFNDFGFIAGKSAIALINNADAVAELDEKLEKSSGTAQEMADTQLDNLAGSVTILKSAFEGLQITIGEALGPAARSAVKFVTMEITALNDIMKQITGQGFDKAWRSNSFSLKLVTDQLVELQKEQDNVNALTEKSKGLFNTLTKAERESLNASKDRTKELQSFIKLRTGQNAIIKEGTVLLQDEQGVFSKRGGVLTTIGKLQQDYNTLTNNGAEITAESTEELTEAEQIEKNYTQSLIARANATKTALDLELDQIKIGNELATSVLEKVKGNQEATAAVKSIIASETKAITARYREQERAAKEATQAQQKYWEDAAKENKRLLDKQKKDQEDFLADQQLKWIDQTNKAIANQKDMSDKIALFGKYGYDRQREEVRQWAAQELEIYGLTKEQKVAIKQEENRLLSELNQQQKLDSINNAIEMSDAVIGAFGSINSAISAFGNAQISEQRARISAEIEEINKREKAEIDAIRKKGKKLSAEEKKILKIQEEADKQRIAKEQEAATEEYKIRNTLWALDVTAATASAALAVARALATPPAPNVPLATIAGIAGAAQVAAVTAAKPQPPQFAQGGIFDGTGVVPGTQFTGDNVNAKLNSGEIVLNDQQQQNVGQAIMGVANGGGGVSRVTIENVSIMISGAESPEITGQAVVTALEEAAELQLIDNSRAPFNSFVGA